LVGVILVKVGPGPGATIKDTGELVPPGVVTVTSRRPIVVKGEIVNLAVTVVLETRETRLTLTPLPALTLTDPKKLLPVSVTVRRVPRGPEDGAIELNTGGGGMMLKGIVAEPAPVLTLSVML